MSMSIQMVIDDYLQCMQNNGFADATITRHRQVLSHLQSFLIEKNMDSEFTLEIIEKFKSECTLKGGAGVINKFGCYLSGRQIATRSPQHQKGVPLPELYESYVTHYCRIRRVSQSMRRHTRKVLADFHRYLSDAHVSVEDLKIEPIDTFLAQYRIRCQSSTVRRILSSVRGFLRYLHENQGILKTDLAALIVAPPTFCRNNPPKFLRRHELRQIFDRLFEDQEGIMTQAMLYLAYCTGLRPSEISRITLDDIEFANAQIRIPLRKGSNPVQFSLPDEAIKAIAAYVIGARPKTDERRLFLNVRSPHKPVSGGQVGRIMTRSIRKTHPEATAYWLRHSYAQNLLESGASIFEIKEMLGHDDIKSTSRYIHVHTSLMRKVLFDETL